MARTGLALIGASLVVEIGAGSVWGALRIIAAGGPVPTMAASGHHATRQTQALPMPAYASPAIGTTGTAALLTRLLPEGAEDDVALVAVCLRPCPA